MPVSPTEIERRILDYMVSYLRENTYQPSIREIGERFGIKSTKTVSEHLQALADKGFLERDPSRSRGVRILGVDLAPDVVSVPCFTELPKGNGSAADRPDLHLTLDRRLVGGKSAYCLRLFGNELSSQGAQDGDLAVLEPVVFDEVPEGAVVALRFPGPDRFFRVTRNGRGIYLTPLDGGDPTGVDDPSTVPVAGRLIAIFRKLDGQPLAIGGPQH